MNSQTTQFIYDGDGNLVKKVNPDNSRTIYVGGFYEVDKNVGGTVTKTTVYYPAGGAMRVNGTLYYVLKDQLGSASVVTDSSGNVVGDQRYYPFGETRLSTGTMYTDQLFTGQRQVTGLGIYHYQSRFYSPKLGRFLSADSIVPNPFNPQDFNRFSYVRNNPVRYVDPSGHICVQNGGGIDNEFAIAGNCNGGEKANYKNPFPGGVPTVNKPGKPKKDDGGDPETPALTPNLPALGNPNPIRCGPDNINCGGLSGEGSLWDQFQNHSCPSTVCISPNRTYEITIVLDVLELAREIGESLNKGSPVEEPDEKDKDDWWEKFELPSGPEPYGPAKPPFKPSAPGGGAPGPATDFLIVD